LAGDNHLGQQAFFLHRCPLGPLNVSKHPPKRLCGSSLESSLTPPVIAVTPFWRFHQNPTTPEANPNHSQTTKAPAKTTLLPGDAVGAFIMIMMMMRRRRRGMSMTMMTIMKSPP
jgi:hypothetical protein